VLLFQFPFTFYFLKIIYYLLWPSFSPSPSSSISSVTCFTRQFLCKMWPIHSDILHFIMCMIFLSYSTLCNTSFFTCSVQLFFSVLLQHHVSKPLVYFSIYSSFCFIPTYTSAHLLVYFLVIFQLQLHYNIWTYRTVSINSVYGLSERLLQAWDPNSQS
jgi:hypothetical protein